MGYLAAFGALGYPFRPFGPNRYFDTSLDMQFFSRARALRWKSLARVLMATAIVGGCARDIYRYGSFADSAGDKPAQVLVRHGEPHKTLDRLSDIVSWPRRAILPELPDRRNIAPETVEQVTRYLDQNDLQGVQVSVRDYQPREQWRRLRQSRVVPPLTRYSFGSLSVVRYTLFPGRVFGRNAYNPYTDTLYVNSNTPALLLHEAAFAKNVRRQVFPGPYAVASHLPILAGWSEFDGANEVLGYARAEHDWGLEEEAYQQVYPKVGATTLVGAAILTPIWWGAPLLSIAGATAGGVAGQTMHARREHEWRAEQAELIEREVTGQGLVASRENAPSEVRQASHAEPRPRRHTGGRFAPPASDAK